MSELSNSKVKFFKYVDNIIEHEKLSHAYLIEVDNYDDDFLYVLDFIKMIILNVKHDSLANSDLNVIKQIDNNEYVDLKIVEPDGLIIKKKQLIDLQEEFQNKSLLNNKRVYVIKEADKLNDASGNTILKFLEEPEDDIVAILVTTNRYKVIDTILSRCQIISMQSSSYELVIDDKVLDLLNLVVKKEDLFVNYQYIFNELMSDKVVAKSILYNLEVLFINYLNLKSGLNEYSLSSEITSVLDRVNVNQIINYIAIIEEEIVKLDYNVNYKLWLDSLFARFVGGK